MPAARTFTPAMAKVRDYADQALNSAEGLSLEFRVGPTFTTLEDAHTAARSFQTTFSSMRAKVRRKLEAHQGKTPLRDTIVRVPYDELSIFKTHLPNGEGYVITFAKSSSIFMDIVCKDLKSGEVVELMSPMAMKHEALWKFFQFKLGEAKSKDIPFVNPWSVDEEYWMDEHYPEYVDAILEDYGLTRNTPKPVSDDLADLSADDLFNEEGEDQ